MLHFGVKVLALALLTTQSAADEWHPKHVAVELYEDTVPGRTMKAFITRSLTKIDDVKVTELSTQKDVDRLDFNFVLMCFKGDDSDVVVGSVILLSSTYIPPEVVSTMGLMAEASEPAESPTGGIHPLLVDQISRATAQTWRVLDFWVIIVDENELNLQCQELIAQFETEFLDEARAAEEKATEVIRQFESMFVEILRKKGVDESNASRLDL